MQKQKQNAELMITSANTIIILKTTFSTKVLQSMNFRPAYTLQLIKQRAKSANKEVFSFSASLNLWNLVVEF